MNKELSPAKKFAVDIDAHGGQIERSGVEDKEWNLYFSLPMGQRLVYMFRFEDVEYFGEERDHDHGRNGLGNAPEVREAYAEATGPEIVAHYIESEEIRTHIPVTLSESARGLLFSYMAGEVEKHICLEKETA